MLSGTLKCVLILFFSVDTIDLYMFLFHKSLSISFVTLLSCKFRVSFEEKVYLSLCRFAWNQLIIEKKCSIKSFKTHKSTAETSSKYIWLFTSTSSINTICARSACPKKTRNITSLTIVIFLLCKFFFAVRHTYYNFLPGKLGWFSNMISGLFVLFRLSYNSCSNFRYFLYILSLSLATLIEICSKECHSKWNDAFYYFCIGKLYFYVLCEIN